MGLLDRFRTSRKPATRPRGDSGRGHIDGYLQLEELNSDLIGERGLAVYDKMYRTDPDVRKNLWMIVNLLVGATWTVQPYGGDDAEDIDREAAKFVIWALFENMRPGWKGHLAQALPVGLRSGFAPFEHLWQTTEWEGREVIAPKMLDLRLPRTIDRWHQREGELTAIGQQLISGSVTLPADDLLYYRFGAEGDNWEGMSLLRPAYKPWLLKDKIERLDAIKQERQAVGVPLCYPPKGASPAQREAMEEVLGNLRSGEQAFVMMPGPKAETMDPEMAQEHGWTMEILGHKQSESSDTKPSLDYHSDKIAAALLAEFMRLGQGSAPGGARATADVQQNPFMQAAEALSTEVEAVVNDGLVARMVALNFEVEAPPRLVMSLVDSTSLTDLANYVSTLVEKGVFQPDNELEDFLRDRADLPPAEAEARSKRSEAAKQALQNPPAPSPIKGDDPKSEETTPPEDPQPEDPAMKPDADDVPEPELPRWGRDLRSWEMFMSLETIDTAITEARQRFEEAAGEKTREIARDFAVAALAGKKQPKAGTELTDTIEAELQRLYRLGQSTVVDELDRQRAHPLSSPFRPHLDADAMRRIKRRASLAADSIAGRIWQVAVRTVLGRGDDLPTTQAAAEVEGAAALRAEAQLHASGALNEGRADQADLQSDEIRGSRYTSILDKNRCEACAAADDDALRPLNDPVRLARMPPNPNCYGGGRCRCMEAFELVDESPGSGGMGGAPAAPEPVGPSGESAASHFEVTGGSADLRQLVEEQMNAIDQVHKMPSGLPRVPVKIENRGAGKYGSITSQYNQSKRTWEWQKISLDRGALGSDPPITSTVHEIGHYLDQWGFGDGAPHDAVMLGDYLSSTDAMREWRDAVVTSRAHRNLVLTNPNDDYLLSLKELLARSYEQWIAEVSQNHALLAKIAKRREDNVSLYWDAADFQPIAVAFDRFFRTRGLR